eukprot:1158127-Pelagomonas_calceolata.AAC.9
MPELLSLCAEPSDPSSRMEIMIQSITAVLRQQLILFHQSDLLHSCETRYTERTIIQCKLGLEYQEAIMFRNGKPTRLASPRPRRGKARGGSLAEWAYPSWQTQKMHSVMKAKRRAYKWRCVNSDKEEWKSCCLECHQVFGE